MSREDSTKHLGLIADSKLNFREHISAQIVKAKKGLALMKHLAKWVSAFVLELTYKMFVRPFLDFGDLIFHNQKTDMMDKLESIQYQAALIVSNCWYGTSQARLYEELGWESLAERRTFRRLAHYYKILSKKTPPYLKEHIKPLPQNSTNRYLNSIFPLLPEFMGNSQ